MCTIKKKAFFLTLFMANSILTGFDVDGRPIIYMRPGRENTETSPRQLRHLVYILYVCSRTPPPDDLRTNF